MADKPCSMMAPEGREIVFAGVGVLWGATTLFRGLRLWKADQSLQNHSIPKSSLTGSLLTGFVLTLGCSVYLVLSLRDSFR